MERACTLPDRSLPFDLLHQEGPSSTGTAIRIWSTTATTTNNLPRGWGFGAIDWWNSLKDFLGMPRGLLTEPEVFDGWLMKKKKEIPSKGESIYYCNERYKVSKCPGAFAIDKNGNIRVVKEHRNHERDRLRVAGTLARQEIKRTANNGNCRQVIDDVRIKHGTAASMTLGGYNAKRGIVYRARGRPDADKIIMNQGGPIQGTWAETVDGKRFLLSKVPFGGKEIIIFASDAGIEILSRSKILFVDGTFDSVPRNFTQLVTIHVYLNENVVRPVVFALLPDKSQATYQKFLQELKLNRALISWNPEILISDFEAAIKNAFENEFPSLEVNGCLFHLIQAWRRKAEILRIYNEFSFGIFEDFWNYLKVLPFIEPRKIPQYFLLIVQTLPANAPIGFVDFVEYVDKYYVGSNGAAPRYPPAQWSCSLRTVHSIHRTTNAVENWHKCLSTVINKYHGLAPIQLSDLVEKLRKEDAHTCLDAAELAVNPNFSVSTSRRTSCILKDGRLKRAVENNPAPPSLPLADLQLLQSFIFAKM